MNRTKLIGGAFVVALLVAGGVDLSFRNALKVDQNDGWITIRTAVDSADTTVAFRESRRVA